MAMQLSWPSDILSRAEGPVLAITSRASSIASLHWQPDGKALALMDANGTLAFCSPNGSIISVTGLNQCAKVGTPGSVSLQDRTSMQ